MASATAVRARVIDFSEGVQWRLRCNPQRISKPLQSCNRPEESGMLNPAIAAIERKCIELAREGISQHGHATFHAVLRGFCSHAGVPHFEMLGLGPPFVVPCLKHLWDFQNLVDSFILAFIGLRPIATLHDLEVEVVDMLNSFCVRPLCPCDETATRTENPDEITLSDDENDQKVREVTVICVRYQDFGMGYLLAYPLVRTHFNCPPFATHIPPYSATDILEELKQFASSCDKDNVDPVQFCDHLTTVFQVAHVEQLGMRQISSSSALRKELLLVRHVLAKQERLLRSKKLLWLEQCHNAEEQVRRAQKQQKHQSSHHRAQIDVGDLKPAADGKVMAFLDRCSQIAHHRSSAVCKHAPSFSQLKEVVADELQKAFGFAESVHSEQQGTGHRLGTHVGKKRKVSKQSEDRDDKLRVDLELVVGIVTEYAMLHLGSRKYRAKRWKMPGEERRDEEAGIEDDEDTRDRGEPAAAISQPEATRAGQDGAGGAADRATGQHWSEVCAAAERRASTAPVGGGSEEEDATGVRQPQGRAERPPEGEGKRGSEGDGGGGGGGGGPDADGARQAGGVPGSKEAPEEEKGGSRGDGRGAAAQVCREGGSSGSAGEGEGVREGGGGGSLRVTVGDHQAAARREGDAFEAVRRFAGKHVTLSGEDLVTCLPWPIPDMGQQLDLHRLGGGGGQDTGGGAEARVGRVGEALVYQLLLRECGGACDVEWCNRVEESRAFYDIKVTPRGADEGGVASLQLSAAVFVEVKTTRWPSNNVFELSLPELHFACREGIRYDIYRVYLPPAAWRDGAGGATTAHKARVTVVKDVASALRERRVQLCMAI